MVPLAIQNKSCFEFLSMQIWHWKGVQKFNQIIYQHENLSGNLWQVAIMDERSFWAASFPTCEYFMDPFADFSWSTVKGTRDPVSYSRTSRSWWDGQTFTQDGPPGDFNCNQVASNLHKVVCIILWFTVVSFSIICNLVLFNEDLLSLVVIRYLTS